MYRNILFIAFLLTSGYIFGQKPFRLSFHHLTREEGLSNNNVFSMHRDSKGFLWLGTVNGLNRFDGTSCRVYKPENSGIRDVDIRNLVEDREGNLWVGTKSGLSRYNRKTDNFIDIHAPEGEKNFDSFPFCIDNKGLLWVRIKGSKSDGLYTYNPKTGQYTFVTKEIAINLPKHQNDNFQEVKTIYAGNERDLGIKKFTLINNRIVKNEAFLNGKNAQPAWSHIGEYTLPESDTSVWISGTYDGLIQLNTNTGSIKLFNQFEGKVIDTGLSHIVRFGKYLIIGSNKGLYFFDTVTEKFVQVITRSPAEISSLMANWNEIPYIDEDQNLFISQLGFGVDFTNLTHQKVENWLLNGDVAKYGLSDNHVAHLVHRGDQTWAKMQSAGTVVLNAKGQIIKYFEGLSAVLNDSRNRVWLTNGREWFLVNQKNEIESSFKSVAAGLPKDVSEFAIETTPGEYLIAGNGLYVMKNKGKTFEAKPVQSFQGEKAVGCHPIFYDRRSELVFLSADWWAAYYIFEKKSGEWVVKQKMNFPFQVYWTESALQGGTVWLATSKGLALLDLQTFEYRLYTEKDGLPDNVVNHVISEKNGNYWLVTNRGIAHYDKKNNAYHNYTSRDGALSKEYDWYGNFILPDKRVVFGGNNGITVIDPMAFQTYAVKPRIQITNFYTNEKILREGVHISERDSIEIDPDQSSFGFDLTGIEFAFPQKLKLQYRLKGIENQWISAPNPASARYANIQAGTYQFMVRAVDETGTLQSDIRSVIVVVNAPFWRAIWFRAGLVVMLIGLGYAFFRLRLNQVKSETRYREELKHVQAQAEINALRSQMNPHFIFNCMNTIDSYIVLSKTNEASEFLQKFSKLVRMILDYSRQEYISIEEDLQALELYIQLEQERANYSFSYEVSVDETLYDKEYMIPSMLFQPFVENAILHGLRHKKHDQGELFIYFKMNKNQLLCTIIDNGIGRAAAERVNFFRKHQSKSVGLKLTEERIKKINEIHEGLAYLKIIDIDMENDSGTIVEIGLPLLTLENLRS